MKVIGLDYICAVLILMVCPFGGLVRIVACGGRGCRIVVHTLQNIYRE